MSEDATRILLLEDDLQLRATLAEALVEQGYEVAVAARGEEAIALAIEQSFDLVVTDIRMEGMDGLDALARVRDTRPEIGSLVVTGYSTEADSIRAIRLGVGEYLKKPFRLKEFLAAVETVLARRRQELFKTRKERALQRSLLWALEAVIRSLDLERGTEYLQAGRTVRAVSLGLGLSQERADMAQLAFCATVMDVAEVECPDFLLESLPAAVMELHGLLSKPGLSRGELPLEARVAAYALQGPTDSDPQLAQAWEQATRTPPAARTAGIDPRLRGLHTLARALEGAGDLAGASRAYHVVSLALVARHVVLALPVSESFLTALQDSLHPEHSPTIAGLLPWLFPYLLRAWAQNLPGSQRPLKRVTREHGLNLLSLVQGLEPGLKRLALQVFLEVGFRPEELRSHFERDPDPELRQLLAQAPPPGEVEIPLLRLYSTGHFEVLRGQEMITDGAWKSQKVRYLLACLALNGGRPVSEDTLMETFWPEDSIRARNNLSVACSHLRRHLRSPGQSRELDYVQRLPSGRLQLNPALPRWHDLDEIEGCLARAHEHRTGGRQAEALTQLRAVAQLYRGPYLDGCYLDWALHQRTRIENEVLGAFQLLAQLALESNHPEECVEASRRGLEIDSCCQELHLLLMQGFLACSRAEEAVRQFQRCQSILRRELQMEPSLALLEWHQRALLSLL